MARCKSSRVFWIPEYVLHLSRIFPLLNQAETQVQPFNLATPDDETLYGWHLIPPHLCKEHEEELNANEPAGPAEDYTQTTAFKLLANNPNARVVVACRHS